MTWQPVIARPPASTHLHCLHAHSHDTAGKCPERGHIPRRLKRCQIFVSPYVKEIQITGCTCCRRRRS